MKKTWCVPVLALAGLAGCHSAESADLGQAIDVDANTQLRVRVEGVEAHAVASPETPPGKPIHRVLQGADGKVVFAYDLQVRKDSADNLYHFLLKPAQQKPTFASAREVTVNSREDSVRVELMERPGTGEKVVDVFSLKQRRFVAEKRVDMSPSAHLMKLHNMFFQWVHGK